MPRPSFCRRCARAASVPRRRLVASPEARVLFCQANDERLDAIRGHYRAIDALLMEHPLFKVQRDDCHTVCLLTHLSWCRTQDAVDANRQLLVVLHAMVRYAFFAANEGSVDRRRAPPPLLAHEHVPCRYLQGRRVRRATQLVVLHCHQRRCSAQLHRCARWEVLALAARPTASAAPSPQTYRKLAWPLWAAHSACWRRCSTFRAWPPPRHCTTSSCSVSCSPLPASPPMVALHTTQSSRTRT